MSINNIENTGTNLTADAVRESIIKLEDAIKTAHPTMPVLLREIHSILKKDPEVVTLLSEEEIAVLVNGLEKQTNIVKQNISLK